MVRGNSKAVVAGGAAMTHIHRWRIAEPDGRKWLPGTCECGETKEFPASEQPWTRNQSHTKAVSNGAP